MDFIIYSVDGNKYFDLCKMEGNMGCYLENDSKEREDILKLEERILAAEKERLNGKGMTIEEVREKLNKENNV